MSDQNSDTGHRPQVIDLEAEEIRSEADAPSPAAAADETPDTPAAPPPPPPASDRRKRSGAATWIIAALVLGALGGGVAYRGLLSDYLPSNRMTALANQVAALQQNNAALTAQLAAVKQGADAAAQAAATANDAAAQAGEAAKAAQEKIGQLGTRLDQGDQQAAALADEIKAAQADLDGLRTTLSTVAAAPAPADGAAATTTPSAPADTPAITALAQRVAALEKDVASLKSSSGPAARAGITTALSQALSDLKAKVAAGTSYQPEYDRIARMVPAAAGLSTVGSYAADGIPDAKGLASELTGAIASLPAAAPPPAEDNSYFGMVMKQLSGVVTVRPIGETDWQQVAQKAADFAANGELTQAIAVIDSAEGEKPVALGQWRDRAAARLALEQATSELSEAVTRQIAAQGGPAQ